MNSWIFDLDGTLIDSTGQHRDSIQRVFQKFGRREWDDEVMNHSRSMLLDDFFTRYLGAERAVAAAQDYLVILAEQIERTRLFAGVGDLLELLRRRGKLLSVWTGRDLASTRECLRKLGIADYFSEVVSGSCVRRMKPHPEGLQMILERQKVAYGDSVVVGDHPFDLMETRRLGARTIGAAWCPRASLELEKYADHKFARVDELICWIEESLKP